MKKILLLITLFTFQFTFSQDRIPEEEKVENLIQVWGLLKYHHPEVTRGKFDFNQEFLEQFERIKQIQSRQEYNDDLLGWVEKFGSKRVKPDPDLHEDTELFSQNADFSWIEDSGFTGALKKSIYQIKNNKNYKDHYASVNRWTSAVEFKNERALENFEVQNEAHRLLFLASFWNAMKYWNPNIYLTETDWKEVLPEMIPAFMEKEPVQFEKAKEKLFAKLNDSHANYYPSITLNSLTNFPNFGGRIVNDSLVVNVLFDKARAENDGIELGDVIFSVEGTNLRKYYTSKFSDVISVSNENYLKRAIEKTYLLASEEDSIKVGVYKKNGTTEEKYIGLTELSYPAEKYVRLRPERQENYKWINEDIGYLNLNFIDEKGLKAAFEEFEQTNGIIIDLRNYPRNISAASLPKYLYPRKRSYVKVLTSKLPSYAKYDTKAALRFIMDPFSAGRRNRNYYKGKVVLLVDRTTASNAEWIGMAIQASPNCTTIGEQTFGAILNRNEFPLLDNTTVDFTKAGAFYPDDQHAQRKGLKIDRRIQESAREYNEDLYMETAINLIREENHTSANNL